MSTPTTEFGFSYEYAVDVKTGEDTFQRVRFISAVDPQVSPVTQDAQTYDDEGAPNNVKTSESWTLSFTVQQHRTSEGAYLPEVEAILALTDPEAVGNAGTGTFRWYDKPAGGRTPNPDEAFEGDGTVQVTRGQTGNDGIGSWNVTVTGQGRRRKIDNPAANGGGGS